MSQPSDLPVPDHNAKRLLLAGSMAILAAAVGFAIRGGIFANWGADFGFTGAQLGAIGGAGFTGFCFGIIIAGVIVDKLGYGKLIVAAFALHVLSAFVTFGATKGQDPATAYNFLFWGMFLFALANGALEGVANPLVSTLFPQNRTHYLNILHASWPAGLVLGGVAGWLLGTDSLLGGKEGFSWKLQLSLYLIPTVLYGILFLGQRFPKSEAAAKGLKIGEMFKDVGILGGLVVCALLAVFFGGTLAPLLTPANADAATAAAAAKNAGLIGYGIGFVLLVIIGVITRFSIGSVLLFVLFIAHLLIGSVELGTDGWIQNITGNILSPSEGKLLFVFTSLVMFGLRFSAHFIEKTLKLSPVGLLLICASLAVVGLNLASAITTFAGALVALFVYALGKTFFWPTMLAIVGDRFPRSGAVAMSIMGGIGMMSVGLLGSPGLGYAKDRFAGEALQASNAEAFTAYQASAPSTFLFLAPAVGLDGTKLAEVQKKDATLRTPNEQSVAAASIAGDRKTLTADSFIPAIMAVIYLFLLIYFKTIGGYKPVRIAETE